MMPAPLMRVLYRYVYRWLPTPGELRAWLVDTANEHLGYCNAKPPNGSGGYGHWRCGMVTGFKHTHRYISYVWNDGTSVEYRPIGGPDIRPRFRHGLVSMRYGERRALVAKHLREKQ